MNAATRPGNTIGDVLKAGIAQYEKKDFLIAGKASPRWQDWICV